jgi:hypothetical protein
MDMQDWHLVDGGLLESVVDLAYEQMSHHLEGECSKLISPSAKPIAQLPTSTHNAAKSQGSEADLRFYHASSRTYIFLYFPILNSLLQITVRCKVAIYSSPKFLELRKIRWEPIGIDREINTSIVGYRASTSLHYNSISFTNPPEEFALPQNDLKKSVYRRGLPTFAGCLVGRPPTDVFSSFDPS